MYLLPNKNRFWNVVEGGEFNVDIRVWTFQHHAVVSGVEMALDDIDPEIGLSIEGPRRCVVQVHADGTGLGRTLPDGDSMLKDKI